MGRAGGAPFKRVSVDLDRVGSVGAFLKNLPACSPSDWTFEGLPPAGGRQVVDYFFMAVKHQYGFWLDDGKKYIEPMYGPIGGRRLKGSDFVWYALNRSAARDASIYNMERQSGMSDSQIFDIFADDAGHCPLPMFETHCALWREYARDMIKIGKTPKEIVDGCSREKNPVAELLRILSSVGGYKEDPLAKKAALLAVILANRPEHFLSPAPGAHHPFPIAPFKFPPIVDYHIQRSALRIGLVRLDDPALESKIQSRKILAEEEEREVRRAVYEAMEKLEEASGKGIDSLDWFFFQNRRRCPEMTEPECPKCEIQSVCARRKDLFQPVRRTTFY